MTYRATLKRLTGGRFYARCDAGPDGLVEAYGDTGEQAVEKLRKEIRYRLELCPCSGIPKDYFRVEVRDLA